MDLARSWHDVYPRNVIYCGRHDLNLLNYADDRVRSGKKGVDKNEKEVLMMGETKGERWHEKAIGRLGIRVWKKVVVMGSLYLLPSVWSSLWRCVAVSRYFCFALLRYCVFVDSSRTERGDGKVVRRQRKILNH